MQLPHNWIAREYQSPLMTYMFGDRSADRKRASCVWHRRAGKDSCSLQVAAVASQLRVGTYWHMLPTLQQGRRVVWEGINKEGERMIDQAFPKELRASTNQSNMRIEFKNGSAWQVVGSDNYDSLVGSNPIGIIFSEFSIADPNAWTYFRPILLENDGFALFIYTPRGKTHGYSLHEMAKEQMAKNGSWFASTLTVDDTGIMTREDVEREIEQGMSREKALQEFYCSFDIGMEGAFWTEELQWAEKQGNIGNFPWDPDKPVQTWWDIGMKDNTSVIFTQQGLDGNPIIIDHDSRRNTGLPSWKRIIDSLPYSFDRHYGPHDIEQTEWGTEMTRSERGYMLGLEFEPVERHTKADLIDATRSMIRRCKFNRDTTQDLRDNLAYYHREWDDKRQIFKDAPAHDHSSHDADAMQYLSVGWKTRSTGRILVKDEITGKYTPNIKVTRAYKGSSRRTARGM